MRKHLRRIEAQFARPVVWVLARLGLRLRITLGFAVGALVLSLVLAGITYVLTRESLLDQRVSSTRSLAINNAQRVRGELAAGEEPGDATAGLRRPSGTQPLLYWDNEYYQGGAGTFSSDALPPSLVETVVEGRDPARMRFGYEGQVYLAVGLPLEGDGELEAASAAYFEVIELEDLEHTLESLTIGLVAAGLVTTGAGAFFGWLGAKRLFRPLDSIREAARRLAGGDLATRVDAGNDPDLTPLALSFNDMVDTLQARIEQDARFASNVTHELRSPLTTLSASLAVLENIRDGLPDRAQTAVDLLVADVNRFTQLIEDLLEMSRLDAGVVNVEPDSVLIAELVMYAVDNQSDRDIPVDVASELYGVVIQVDKRRLLRVIANLLDNAAKYAGGADRVEMRVVEDSVQIAIEDGGPGVKERDRQRIFDRFSRGWVEGERAKRKGVGLGLSIVAEHVRIHGGEVWVEDRPDGQPGARFVFTLPIDPANQPEAFEEGEDLSLPLETVEADGARPNSDAKDRLEA